MNNSQFFVWLRAALFPLATILQIEAAYLLWVCEYDIVCLFDDFYEEDMEVVRMLVPTGTLTKKTCHEIRGPKKSMQKLGLAVDTGIGRDPFSDPVLSHFLHFFWKKFVLVEGGKNQL